VIIQKLLLEILNFTSAIVVALSALLELLNVRGARQGQRNSHGIALKVALVVVE
jgi:hypothetical protein